MPRTSSKPAKLTELGKAVRRLLADNVKKRIMTPAQSKDVWQQYRTFEAHRRALPALRVRNPGRVVGYAGGLRYLADTPADLIATVEKVDSRLRLYFEQL
jgi:hypothetical protein